MYQPEAGQEAWHQLAGDIGMMCPNRTDVHMCVGVGKQQRERGGPPGAVGGGGDRGEFLGMRDLTAPTSTWTRGMTSAEGLPLAEVA